MPSFNQVTLMGNLTRDPELRDAGGTAVCDLGLAVNRTWKNRDGEKQEEVSFFDITVWAASAENCAKYLSKGRAVLVSGRLLQDRWQDKESGENRSKVKVVASSVQFLGGKNDDAAKEDDGGEPPF